MKKIMISADDSLLQSLDSQSSHHGSKNDYVKTTKRKLEIKMIKTKSPEKPYLMS